MESENQKVADGSPETYETNKTYSVTNAEFLDAVFGKEISDARPMVISFGGNPAKVKTGAWTGYAWNPNKTLIPARGNNYYSIAAFRRDESGAYRRKKAQFDGLYVIVLDDIGTKIPLERLSLLPSYLLETSEGNFQAGYFFQEPLREALVAERLMNAVIAAELCDPGLSGPTARIVRLPEGVNGKHQPSFKCKMREWNPLRRYTVEQIIDGLQIDMSLVETKGKIKKQRVQKSDGDDILVPQPTENKVLAALKTRGLYKTSIGEGKHDITCPWVNEHTGAVDGGSAYFDPDDTYPIGGFKCMHGHCAHRRIRDLLQFLSLETRDASMKPTIQTNPGHLHSIVDIAEQVLAKTGNYYQRGGSIVAVVTDPSTKETSIRDVNQNALTGALSIAANWEKYHKKEDCYSRIDPPPRPISVLYDSLSYKHLPVLKGLARQPFLRPDGTLVTESGYDPSTAIYGVFNPHEFSIPALPTRQEAENALRVLETPLAEFPFASPTDRAAALAACLTAAIRPVLPTAPMFHAKAPVISSGKSYLNKVISGYASPQRAAPMTFPQDDEECRKVLHAEFMRSSAVIEFDNLTGDLVPHKSLCASLTEENYTGRVLGLSKTISASTRVLFLSSGNNVSPVGDMTRRTVTINLDPACETPATRVFKKPDLLADFLHERGGYVSAALTVIRAWVVAGRPKTECKALGSYTVWSDLCRQSLLWLGLPDPATSVFEAMTEDPDREILGRFLEAWHIHFGNTPKMVREAANADALYPGGKDLQEVLQDIAGERDGLNRRKLGRWISRHANRIVDGRRLVRADGKRSAEAWFVELVS